MTDDLPEVSSTDYWCILSAVLLVVGTMLYLFNVWWAIPTYIADAQHQIATMWFGFCRQNYLWWSIMTSPEVAYVNMIMLSTGLAIVGLASCCLWCAVVSDSAERRKTR